MRAFVGTFIIHHLIFLNECCRKRCNVQVLQRVQACVSGRSRYLSQMQSTSCLLEMQVSASGSQLHLKRCRSLLLLPAATIQYSIVGAKSFPGATAAGGPNHTGRGYDDSFAPKHHRRQCGSSCLRTGVRLLHGLLSLLMTCTMQYIKYIMKYNINLYL